MTDAIDNLEMVLLLDVAPKLKMTQRTLHRDLVAGGFKVIKLGGKWKVRRTDLEKFLAQCPGADPERDREQVEYRATLAAGKPVRRRRRAEFNVPR